MELYIGADHRGWELKNNLKDWLTEKGHQVTDLGADSYNEKDNYPDFGFKVGEGVVALPESRRGIVVCGSGVGIAIAANKVPGVRAGVIFDPRVATVARKDDDINVLALGADYITFEQAKEIVQAFLETEFSDADRHRGRLEGIRTYETNSHSQP